MKYLNPLLLPSLLVLLFMLPAMESAGQTGYSPWDLLSDLLDQMDQNTNSNFSNNLDNLNNNWDVDFGQNNNVLQDLNNELDGPFPPLLLDSSYLNAFGPGLDLILGGLPGFGLPGSDEDTLLNQYGNINDIFASNFDSLGNLYGLYQDSLQSGPNTDNWNVTVIGLDSLTNEQYGALQDTFDMSLVGSTANGPGGLANMIGNLFNEFSFPDLELAFGIQESSLNYWDLPYTASAKVLRVGSVPRFDQTANICYLGQVAFPIEARWHLQASWIDREVPATATDAGQSAASSGQEGFVPLLFGGDFAIMATPGIGALGNTSFRLITSIGIEVGTYAPSHSDYNPARTAANQGFATGFGPQAGTGFAFTNGPVTVYTLGTVVVAGETLRCALPYQYTSAKFEAGIRYGNIINVRYSTGRTSWQPNGNRLAKVSHQFTVGIILNELHP